MKRVVYCSTELSSDDGFYFVAGNKAIFLKSDSRYLTDKILRQFINKLCSIKKVGDAIRQSALYNEATLKDFRRRTVKATLKKIDTGNIIYYNISGDNFTENFPEEEFENTVIVI